MKVVKVEISKLKPFPGNPRIHPASAVEKIINSIEKFGWTNPILASKDGYILAGHARLKAAEWSGIKEVPVIYLPLEGEKAKAYLLADNRLREDTQWDYKRLRELLLEIQEEDLDILLATGFDEQRTETIVESFSGEQFVRPDVTEMVQAFEAQEQKEQEEEAGEEYCPKVGAGKEETGGWFYVQYYGQDIRFNALKEIFEEAGVMKTQHEIDGDFFYDMIMSEVGEEN